jgi:YjbR protein
VTADDFRKLALSLPEAVESAHMHHPDFRVRGKIFATIGYPDRNWAVAKLTPEE